MEIQTVAIERDDPFRFSCQKGVSCFGVCCRDLHQHLTPYDILRIKKALNLSSTQFLKDYTKSHTGQGSGFPVITLKSLGPPEFICPFLRTSGCRVYLDRPTSCRLYPLARAVSRSRETGKTSVHFALIREPFCRGFDTQKTQTAKEWIESQDAGVYLRVNDGLLDLITLKNRLGPDPLSPKLQFFFTLALYDLDRFRKEVDKGLLEGFSGAPDPAEALRMDDVALLALGQQWIASLLRENL